MKTVPYDVLLDNEKMDMSTTLGLITATASVLRIRPHGLLFCGCPCSSKLGVNLHVFGQDGQHS